MSKENYIELMIESGVFEWVNVFNYYKLSITVNTHNLTFYGPTKEHAKARAYETLETLI